MNALPKIEATPEHNQNDNSFAQFKLPPALATALIRMDYNRPTPIQAQAIPFIMKGCDILGSAQTGTGKTGAFAIPAVARLITDPKVAVLVLTPTRELATQIMSVVQDLLHKGRDNNVKAIRTALLIGGESMGRQFDQLRANPRLIIGTPGRINDHLRRNGALFKNVQMVVLDEADRMLDMGFSGQIDDILKHVDEKKRQTLMFSATFPDSIIRFSKKYLTDPQRVTIDPELVTVSAIKQEVVRTTEARRYDDLTGQLDQRSGSIIVFVRTKYGADRLAKKLGREGHDTGVIHGGLRQNKRAKAIAAFRTKKIRVMVATDVAARGLDVPHIEHVINYDLPQNAEDYVHRIGRTARAGAEGAAVSFVMPSDGGKWRAINDLMGTGSASGEERPGSRTDNSKKRKGKPRRSKGGGKGGAGHRKGKSFNAKKNERDYSPKRGKRNERSHNFRKKMDSRDGETRTDKEPAGDKARKPNANGKPSFKKRADSSKKKSSFKKGGFKKFSGPKKGGFKSGGAGRRFKGKGGSKSGQQRQAAR